MLRHPDDARFLQRIEGSRAHRNWTLRAPEKVCLEPSFGYLGLGGPKGATDSSPALQGWEQSANRAASQRGARNSGHTSIQSFPQPATYFL